MLHPAITRQDCPDDLQKAWERQQKSAKAILDRYEDGMDTVLLADDVGMGKTYTALTVAAHTLLTDPRARLALVTPPGLVSKWEQEIHSFNDIYIQQEGRSGTVLRPRVVENYWDMATLLHEYSDQEKQRVSASAHACLLRVFCQWHDKAMKPGRGASRLIHLPAAQDVAEDSPEFLQFCSLFSPRSLEFFFSRQQRARPQDMKARVVAVREGRSEDALNNLFKEFCRQQSEHAPNIFILRMSSLQRGRTNAAQSLLLHTWLALRLFAGLWSMKREVGMRSVLRWAYHPDDVRGGGNRHREWLEHLAHVDLWGLRDLPFPEQEADAARRALLTQTDRDSQASALKTLHIALIACKMSHAGFALAIVDEAHNWRGGKHGAGAFQQNYAPHIPRTLLLTATPFQLHPQELKVILQHVAAKKVQSSSLELVEQLTRPDGLFTACLNASKRFEKAWEALPPACGPWLQRAFEAPLPVANIVTSLPKLPNAPLEIASFSEAVVEWRNKMQELRIVLGRIMIRHSKSRRQRQVHAGCEYVPAGNPSLSPHRPGLYEILGYGGEEDALISFLSMRTDQLLRQENRGNTENAHLREGLSSSFAAFLESHEKKHAASTALLSEDTRAYVDFFTKALKKAEHPKVRATAERALHNFRQGKKTLIFCERLATQKELYKKFCQHVLQECFPGGGLKRAENWRNAILREPLLVDWHLSRSLCLCEDITLNAAQRRQAATEAQAHARRLRLRGKRRMARLLDLYLLRLCLLQERGDNSLIGCNRRIASALAQLLDDAENLRAYLEAEISEQEQGEASADFEKMAKTILSGQNIWHTGKNPQELHARLWDLLLNEWNAVANEQSAVQQLIPALKVLPQGLRRILLRLDVLQKLPRRGHDRRKSAGLIATAWLKKLFARDDKDRRAWNNTVVFVNALLQADGTLLGATSRRESLWRGVSLKQHGRKTPGRAENLFAATLNGGVTAERRTALCAAFNAPIYPDVLLCTSIGSEGIDLHRCCAEIIHHDLPWNPARLEQRNGRIDRVGSLAEKERGHMYFGIPFLAHDYEDYQYKTVQQRAQRLEVLLGVDRAYGEIEKEILSASGTSTVREMENIAPSNKEADCVSLPENLVRYLHMDFGVTDSDVR